MKFSFLAPYQMYREQYGEYPSRERGTGARPGWVIMLCSWALHFNYLVARASFYPGVELGTGECSGELDEIMGGR